LTRKVEMLRKHFRRTLPASQVYRDRLARELQLIEKFNFANVFLQTREILDLVPEYRFITRGSAGCSLVAYLMGIHDMDPVQNNFILSRFMHENRKDNPDIDVDFAYNQRDIVLEKVMQKYPGRVARISNHVKYQKNSAIRQALRNRGNRKFIPKHFNLVELTGSNASAIAEEAALLEGTFKNYSLHCGGIVIFPDKVPEHLKISNSQIKLNKDEIEDRGYFKIDLLCNRGLAQLNDLSSRSLDDYPEYDSETASIFQNGDTWGVTFAESPAQRRLHLDIRPSCRSEVAFSLALIRPLPSADGRKIKILDQFHKTGSYDGCLVYDDDGIRFIQGILNCSESEAESFRKGFSKKDAGRIDEFKELIKDNPDRNKIMKELGYFSLYSFCRAHAMSYAKLVWALAYEKVRQPKKFWWSALNHAQSLYRPWVHVQEAKKAGLKFAAFGRGPWKLIGDELHPSHVDSIHDGWNQHAHRGYWTSNRFMPGMFSQKFGNFMRFRGLIATGRYHTVGGREITFITIGTDTGKYLDLVLDGTYEFDRFDVVEGEGWLKNNSIQCQNISFDKLSKEPQQKMLFAI
jgi:DNA polymerase III alpha subunit